MIAHVRGALSRIESSSVVLDANGIGYRVFTSAGTLAALPPLGEPVLLVTSLVVREDELSLYGFLEEMDLQVFQMLTGVTGVGPKVALSLLSISNGTDLARSIASNDTRALSQAAGVGPKLAQRIALELGEKMAELAFDCRISGATAASSTMPGTLEDALEALLNLGYSRADARRAAERAVSLSASGADATELVRVALRLLAESGAR